MMDETMVERVARAIYEDQEAVHIQFGVMPAWESLGDYDRRRVAETARAAIDAMREPTEAMFEAFGADIDWEVFPGYWARAIDTAKGAK